LVVEIREVSCAHDSGRSRERWRKGKRSSEEKLRTKQTFKKRPHLSRGRDLEEIHMRRRKTPTLHVHENVITRGGRARRTGTVKFSRHNRRLDKAATETPRRREELG